MPLTAEEIERGRRLGAFLRKARGDRSMVHTALDAGLSPETLRKIESGRVATPSFSTVAAIADAAPALGDDALEHLRAAMPGRVVDDAIAQHMARARNGGPAKTAEGRWVSVRARQPAR